MPPLTARGVLGIIGAGLFAYAGLQMVTLRSVGGTSVAEVFYQAMGWFAFGMAALSLRWMMGVEPPPV